MRNYDSPAAGKIGFLAATQIPAGGYLDWSLQFPAIEGDFNGDGKPDVATVVRDLSGSLSISIVLSNGDGSFNQPVLTPVPGQNVGFQFVIGDVNGDHRDDMVIVHQIDFVHPVATMVTLLSNGDGTFTVGNSYSITSNPLAAGTLADVNGDGKLDVIVADQATPPNVWTLLGNGDGTFGAANSTPLSGMSAISGTYMVFADLNGDGLVDIAQISTNGELTVYLATSPVTFAAPSYYSTVDGHLNAFGIAVGDLNGDGRPEIVVPNGTDNNITVYMNNGDGTFQSGGYVNVALAKAPDGTVANVWPSGVTIADVNGDGKADIISSNQGSADITVLLGNGDGTFRPPSIGYAVGGYPATAATVADFDGDGIPDLIVSDYEFSLVYLKGYGDGTFRAAHNYYSPIPDQGSSSFGLSIASGDFNGDRQPDFVTSNFADPSSGITVFLSRPDGTLLPGINYGSGGGYMSVAVADFNQHGTLDIAAVDMIAGVVHIFSGNGDGTFAETGQFMTDSSIMGPEAIVAADFNGDGYPDMAVLNYGTFDPTQSGYNVAIMLNNRAGGFVLSANYPLSGRVMYPTEIVAASLKGNGNIDLLVPLLYKPALAVFSGNGDGTFQPENDIAVDDVPSDVAVADLNQDGKPDLAVSIGTFATVNGIDVALGNGDGTFQAPQLVPASVHNSWDLPLPRNINVVDVDGDGKLDLVYTNSEFGTLGVLFGQGNGSFLAAMEWPVGGFPWGLAIADLNQDGAPDVVVAGDEFAGVTVLLNANGSAVAPNYSLSPSTSSINLTSGASSTLEITAASQHTFTGTITFGCSGLPVQLSCAFNPPAVQLNGNQQVTIGLTISTSAAAAGASVDSGSPQPYSWNRIIALGSLGAFGFLLFGSGKKHKNLSGISMILMVLGLSLMFTSCGGAVRSITPNTGTSARTYVVQVNATAVDQNTGRSISNSLSLNVTLK